MSQERLPWQAGSDVLPMFFAGVSTPGRVDREAAIEVLRGAVDLANAWIGVDVTWSTFVSVGEDDMRAPMEKMSRPGLDWEFISTRSGTAALILLTGVCTDLADYPWHPNHTVAEVAVWFPVFVAALGRDAGRMCVGVSVQRWAMYGSGENMPWIAGPVGPWVARSVEIMGADTGYAILDQVKGSHRQSPLESRSMPPAGGYGSVPDVWGYGWGTLLSPSHLERIGGVEGLPGAHVEQLPGGRVWVTLGDDPSQVPEVAMWGLHEALQPAFPAPRPQWIEEPVDERAIPRTVGDVREAWQAAAASARAAGRTGGTFGPVGFTLDAGVPELVVPHGTVFTDGLIMFEDLDAEAAAVLLGGLDAEALDERAGPGPTLRAALRAAVAHPGVVRLNGHAVGPSREDERVTVDGIHIHDDPVLDLLGPGDREQAWRRVQELGIDDAQVVPDELRAPSAVGGPWIVWWD